MSSPNSSDQSASLEVAAAFPHPDPPQLDGINDMNQAKCWRKLRQNWEAYAIVTGLERKDPKVRVATLVMILGPDAIDVYNALDYEQESDKEKLDVILTLMEEHYKGKVNVTFERFQFFKRDQLSTEPFANYLTAVRTLIQSCEFGSLEDELLRDRLVCGISNTSVQKSLLQKGNLTLKKCIDAFRASENSAAQLREISHRTGAESTTSVAAANDTQDKETVLAIAARSRSNINRASKTSACHFCGRQHEPQQCPAFDKVQKRSGKKSFRCGVSTKSARCVNPARDKL